MNAATKRFKVKNQGGGGCNFGGIVAICSTFDVIGFVVAI